MDMAPRPHSFLILAGRSLVLTSCLWALTAGPSLGQARGPVDAPPSTHVVQPGDTLWDLSRRYMDTPLRWPEIQRDNEVPVPKRLRPGQLLAIGSTAAILDLSGEVHLDRPPGGAHALAAGMQLQPGDVLITGRNGFVAVAFSDGSRIVVPSSSAVRLLEARGQATRFELLDGRIESYVEQHRRREFEIRTRTHALGVRGTHFRVRADRDASTLEVLEGSVLATPLHDPGTGLAVPAGQGLPLEAGAVPTVLLPPPTQRIVPEPNVVVADPVPGAHAYRLQLSRDPEFFRLVAESRAERPRFELATDTVPGFYHTRLTAFDAQRVEGRAGSGIVFLAGGAPPLESTVHRLANGSFEIRWTARHSQRHTFELARSPDFAAPLFIGTGDYSGGVAIDSLEGPARYYWRCSEAPSQESQGESQPLSVWGGSFEVPAR